MGRPKKIQNTEQISNNEQEVIEKNQKPGQTEFNAIFSTGITDKKLDKFFKILEAEWKKNKPLFFHALKKTFKLNIQPNATIAWKYSTENVYYGGEIKCTDFKSFKNLFLERIETINYILDTF